MSELEQRLRRDAQRLSLQPSSEASEKWRRQLYTQSSPDAIRRSPAPAWMFAAAAMVAVAALVAVRPSTELATPEPIFRNLPAEEMARSMRQVPEPLEAEAAAIARDLERVRKQTEQWIGLARSQLRADA